MDPDDAPTRAELAADQRAEDYENHLVHTESNIEVMFSLSDDLDATKDQLFKLINDQHTAATERREQ